jgi:3-methyladenine DNA glycosylase/8-oxoguanine DNA glycosylase
MSPRVSYAAAEHELVERSAVMAALVAAAGPIRLRPPQDTHFAALVRSITYQQLAGAAAATIHGRLVAALDGQVAPEALLVLSPEVLRAAGLSANKAASARSYSTRRAWPASPTRRWSPA